MGERRAGAGIARDNNEIQDEISKTYVTLRRGLIIIGVSFPLILWALGSLWFGVPFQSSMSDYYFADSTGTGIAQAILDRFDLLPPIRALLMLLAQFDPHAPMRTWFVGLLFGLGTLMILYRGFSVLETWLLNFAGAFAMGVALFPTGCQNCVPFNIGLHGLCALAAFGCLVLEAWFCSKQTLHIEGLNLPESTVKQYERKYNMCAVLMGVFPIAAVIVSYAYNFLFGGATDGLRTHVVFFIESFGLWSFALYWAVKTRELAETGAEVHAIHGRLERSAADLARKGPLVVKKLRLVNSGDAAHP